MELLTGRFLDAIVTEMATAVPPAVTVADDDEESAIPAELRNWLVRLRLLEGVPFAHLVPDSALLPPESIRWFYLDRRWTDAVVQGALSVGTVNSDDRAQLTAQYPAVRDELDHEERNHRRRTDRTRRTGETGPISGFLLRSAAVSGWPGLHVRAFSIDPTDDGRSDDARHKEDEPGRMRLLRLERLAPAVLLCLFDGIPKVVHIEEPRQGVQFGFEEEPETRRARLHPRNASTFEYIDVNGNATVDEDDRIDVPFRRGGASGVVDIQRLERVLGPIPGTGAADQLDSAEYALQLIRFPWRQVYGDPRNDDVRVVFKPRIAYAQHVSAFRTVIDG